MIELIEKRSGKDAVSASAHDTLTLPFDLRQKSRQRVRLDGGGDAAVLLPRGNSLARGDVLMAADGTCVRVEPADEAVSTGRSDDALLLARACYHLGNRHVPLQIGVGFVRYQPDHVLDDMLRGLGMPVVRELAPFEPEGGAYAGHGGAGASAGHAHGHTDAGGSFTLGDDTDGAHAHAHAYSHAHSHPHSHVHAHTSEQMAPAASSSGVRASAPVGEDAT